MLKRIIFLIYRCLIPCFIAYVLLVVSAWQPRPYFVSRFADLAVRVALILFSLWLFWACGNVITGDVKKDLRKLNRDIYLSSQDIYRVIGVPVVMGCIASLGYSSYKIARFFLPFSAPWRYLIVILVVTVIGWAFIKFYVEWIRWLASEE